MERPKAKPAKARKMTQAEIAAYKEEQARKSDPGRVKFYYPEEYVVDVEVVPGGGAPGVHDPEGDFDTHRGPGWAAADHDWSYDDSEDTDGEEGRWDPPGDGSPVILFSRQAAADYAGIPERWIAESRVVPFPDPDGRVGSTLGWLQSTIDNWFEGPPRRGPRRDPVHFLSRSEVAPYTGVTGRSGLMPPPDVIMGSRRGWLPATIDAWRTQRPRTGRPRSS